MGWIELFVGKILPETGIPERAAPFVFALLVALLSLFGLMPFYVLWIARQVGRVRSALALSEEKLDRLAQRAIETQSMVRESFTLVQDRLAGVPPPVRFGPEGGSAKAAEAAAQQPGTIPEGQGLYNYCPSCKEIRFIKFFRCQTCGFHVPR